MVAHNDDSPYMPDRVHRMIDHREAMDEILRPHHEEIYAKGYTFQKSCRTHEVAEFLAEYDARGLDAIVTNCIADTAGEPIGNWKIIFTKIKSE